MIFDLVLIAAALVLCHQGWRLFHVEQFWGVVMIGLGLLVFIGTVARHYQSDTPAPPRAAYLPPER